MAEKEEANEGNLFNLFDTMWKALLHFKKLVP